MAKKDKLFKIETILKNYNDYKIYKDLVLYLRKKRNFYQGKIKKKKKNVEKTF